MKEIRWVGPEHYKRWKQRKDKNLDLYFNKEFVPCANPMAVDESFRPIYDKKRGKK